MTPMMTVGTQRLAGVTRTGPHCRPFCLVCKTVDSEIASRKTGKAQIRSIVREIKESVQPRKKPEMTPKTSAIRQQITAEATPIRSEFRPP